MKAHLAVMVCAAVHKMAVVGVLAEGQQINRALSEFDAAAGP